MLPPLIFAFLALVLSFVGPGCLLLRGWNADPGEKFAVSVALSLLLIHLLSFSAFVLGMGEDAHDGILILCAGLTIAAARELGRLFESREARSMAGWLGLLALGSVAGTAVIRNYSGGTWYGDWLEHYQRSLFFLGGMPADFKFQGNYLLPARPPLMNVLCAHFMAVVDRQYPVYQLLSALLNTLVFLPVALLARLFSPRRRLLLPAAAAILLFNPMWVQNATYAWTKLLAAFYVLLAVHLYLTALPERDRPRLLLAFACLAAGTLAHYSAGPYLVFFAIHFVLAGSKGWKERRREIALAAAVSGTILATWLAWSLGTYGAGTTVASTSSVRDAQALSGSGNAIKVVRNLWNTLVPHPLRGVDLNVFAQGLTWGALRDASFKMYQQNLPLAFGIAGLPLLLLALFRTRSGPASRGLPGRGFWIVFSLYTVIAGIAVHGGDDPVGLAHICLQPFILIGLAFLASRWEDWPPALRIAAAAGLLADFLLGVALHFWFQATPFLPPNPARGFWHLTRHDLLIGSPKANWDLKSAGSLIFLGDGAAPFRPALLLALAIPLLYTAYRLASTTLHLAASEKLPPTQRKARKDPPARRSR